MMRDITEQEWQLILEYRRKIEALGELILFANKHFWNSFDNQK